jgi:hypothetical protein
MYQGSFDTDFDKYTEDAVMLFSKYGINTVFENLEGFPENVLIADSTIFSVLFGVDGSLKNFRKNLVK